MSRSLKGNKNGLGYVPSDEARSKMKNAHVRRIESGLTKQIVLDDGVSQYQIPMAKLKEFCKARDLSASTFQSQMYKKWPRSRRGKNKGWASWYLESAVTNDTKAGQFSAFVL
jgi:hypothetical protein